MIVVKHCFAKVISLFLIALCTSTKREAHIRKRRKWLCCRRGAC
ncbi:hypothetical protein KP509_19G036800 [Ceratopteris richardii]|uniref:Uncharacterized protein n=1 Tax=Ceratopteris richardii TaxID=49495 RepID=A0A8T2SJQ0_CERRI|nr:hypothetical protein KP509_19G036800 [Ceratopteris richardii]